MNQMQMDLPEQQHQGVNKVIMPVGNSVCVQEDKNDITAKSEHKEETKIGNDNKDNDKLIQNPQRYLSDEEQSKLVYVLFVIKSVPTHMKNRIVAKIEQQRKKDDFLWSCIDVESFTSENITQKVR